MKIIKTTNGKSFLIDDADALSVERYKWYALKHRYVWYVARYGGKENQSHIYLHRQLLGTLKGQLVDHINGDGLDNRRINIRICTPRENQLNRHDKRKALHVSYDKLKKRWRIQIRLNGKNKNVGRFKTKKEALRHVPTSII